jgi:carbonic anhydrase
MIEIVWQLDSEAPRPHQTPLTSSEAWEQLTQGNQLFADILRQAEEGATNVRAVVDLSAHKLGLTTAEQPYPIQRPFAVVVGCSDARVPIEMILWQQSNDVFVVRVAGNIPGLHAMGSLDFAVRYVESVRLLVVLGHTKCGAVTAAVDAFLTPSNYMSITAEMPLRSIVDSIMTAVVGAADAMSKTYGESVKSRPGYRDALVELAIILNAALTATAVRQTFEKRLGTSLAVAYGVFNLRNHLVGLPDDTTEDGWKAGLYNPPLTPDDLVELALHMAGSRFIEEQLSASSNS